MKRKLVLVLVLVLGTVAGAMATPVSHENFITSYEGPQTCLKCHPGEADEVVHSVHYKLKGPATTISGVTGEWGSFNRECGLPGSIMRINWLGVLDQEQKIAGDALGAMSATVRV